MLKPLVLSGLAAAAALTGVAPASAATTSSCGTLPSSVQGNPGVKGGQAGSFYLFHDSKGWKLRVTHPVGTREVVAGSIMATKDISHLAVVHLERGDAVAISRDGHTLSFRFTNVGHLDGVDFTAECSHELKVNLKLNGKQATTPRVFLGAHRVHPTSVPFAIERH